MPKTSDQNSNEDWFSDLEIREMCGQETPKEYTQDLSKRDETENMENENSTENKSYITIGME